MEIKAVYNQGNLAIIFIFLMINLTHYYAKILKWTNFLI